YQLTASGEREFKQWLAQPVTRDEIVGGLGELMLRFAFMEQALGAKAAIAFLRNLRNEVTASVPGLKQFPRENGPRMPLSGMLALDSGISNYEALQQWVEYATQTYEQSVANKKQIGRASCRE